MTEELVINEDNFEEHFFDIRKNKPRKGQIIACYTAMAEFVDGPEKRNIIDLLRMTNKMEPTAQVMRKLLYASELDAYRVPRLMAEDMLKGMSRNKVAAKPYKYKIEVYYYTKPENVPKDDPHWSIIEIMNLEEFVADEEFTEVNEDGEEVKARITSKIIHPRTYRTEDN